MKQSSKPSALSGSRIPVGASAAIFTPRRMDLPAPSLVQVSIDFDGTMTQLDVLDELIARFTIDGSWQQIEREWQSGRIGSEVCLREEFALLRIRPEQLEALLDRIPLDPGVRELFDVFQAFDVPVAILSDGVDAFIDRLLGRLGLAGLCIRANAVQHRGERIELECPHFSPQCEVRAAHCKCASTRSLALPDRRSVYIGDGLSDLCPARKADFVFAKGALAQCLEREGIAFIPYSTLLDVKRALLGAWGETAAERDPIRATGV